MNLKEIPKQGMMYALYKDKVVFRRYESSELPEVEIVKKDLLELHLFDSHREYRYIKIRQGEIETVIEDASEVYEDSYVERIFVRKEQLVKSEKETESAVECVEVVNYITYDENDLIRIDNYRLREVR